RGRARTSPSVARAQMARHGSSPTTAIQRGSVTCCARGSVHRISQAPSASSAAVNSCHFNEGKGQ
ncbi:hypothetical protein HGM15179_002064, partial [Zosterops borbonicus]